MCRRERKRKQWMRHICIAPFHLPHENCLSRNGPVAICLYADFDNSHYMCFQIRREKLISQKYRCALSGVAGIPRQDLFHSKTTHFGAFHFEWTQVISMWTEHGNIINIPTHIQKIEMFYVFIQHANRNVKWKWIGAQKNLLQGFKASKDWIASRKFPMKK